MLSVSPKELFGASVSVYQTRGQRSQVFLKTCVEGMSILRAGLPPTLGREHLRTLNTGGLMRLVVKVRFQDGLLRRRERLVLELLLKVSIERRDVRIDGSFELGAVRVAFHLNYYNGHGLMYHTSMRIVTLADADELAELDMLLFPAYCLNEQSIRIEIAVGTGWVIREREKIVAYALVRKDGPLLDITRLGVHPHYQRRGFGSQLLARVKHGGCRVMLTVLRENRDALRLYLRKGFRIVGDLTSGGWVMEYVPTAVGETRTSHRLVPAEP